MMEPWPPRYQPPSSPEDRRFRVIVIAIAVVLGLIAIYLVITF